MVKYRICLLLFCSIYLLANTKINAQYVLQGQVSDTRKAPVASASIKIKDSARGLPRFFAISDKEGKYRIRLPAGNKQFWLECSLLGYRNISFILPAPAGPVQLQDILLTADTADLPAINVYSIPPVTVSGDTTTFRVDAFKKGNESNVGELLNVVPGFSVNNGRISYNGRAVTKVLIEDDDLFGSDYNTITQNLSPRGIEKIQLIENYNDKTYLSNRLKKGDELVVNLKFNKKFLFRVIASNEAGISLSPAADFYKIRQNIVSLLPRLKSVTTTNFNNTGLLATEVLGTAFNIPELAMYQKDAINFDLFPRFSASPVELLPDIYSSIVPRNRMVNNHSSVITNNTLFRPSKKAQFKGIIQYYRDAFEQQQWQTTDYSVSGINLKVQGRQFLQKKLPVLNASVESVISASTYSQLVYKAGFSSRKQTDSLDDTRQSVETYTSDQIKNTRFQQQLGYSFAIDSSSIIDIRALHNTESSQRSPLLSPANLYTSLTGDSISSKILSEVNMHNTEYILQAKLTKRNKKSNWSAELVQSFSRSGLGSGITLFQPGMAVQPGDPVLLNDVLLQTNISGIVASYNVPLSKSVYLRTTHRLESGHLRLHNRKIPETIAYTHYLPSIGLTLHLNQNNQLGINLDIKNRLPQAYKLADGYMFASAGSIVKGNDQMQTGISRTVSLSYSYTEMMKRKMFFILSAYCSREPVLYLSDIAPSVFYTLRNTDIVNKDLSVMAVNAMVSKYVRAIKSQVGMETMVNRFTNYYSSNHIPGTISLSGISAAIKCKTLVTNNLITNISARISAMRQDIDKGLLTHRSNHSNTFTGSTELVYKMNGKWTCSVRHQYIHQRQSDKDYSLHMGEFAIRYMAIKDRLNITLSGNNLLTGNRFNSITFTQFSINTQSIDLVRPYLMVQASLEL